MRHYRIAFYAVLLGIGADTQAGIARAAEPPVVSPSSITARQPAVPMPPAETLGIALEGYPYPYPVRYLERANEGQMVRMAYMDVLPQGTANGKTVFLLHGKNFFGAYWRDVIARLSAEGYRVVVPDQVGFGKSSKPQMPYSFDLLARNTVALADELKLSRFAVLGHSMGGMVAMRLARAYPDRVERLILENPIGLEDYQQAVPYKSTDERYQAELTQSPESFRAYVSAYYVKKDPGLIEPFVAIRTAISRSGEFPRWALSAALTTQMILQQPTVYDLPQIKAPTLLIIGQADRTAVGKAEAPEAIRATLGNYPELGQRAAKTIPNARLVPIPNVGHIPHLEAPEAFYAALLPFLKG